MNNVDNQHILDELYEIEPKLRKHEKELGLCIEDLMKARPNTEIDPLFEQNLRLKLAEKCQLLKEAKATSPSHVSSSNDETSSSFWVFPSMRSLFIFMGSAAASAAAFFIVLQTVISPVTVPPLGSVQPRLAQTNHETGKNELAFDTPSFVEITQIDAEAYGELDQLEGITQVGSDDIDSHDNLSIEKEDTSPQYPNEQTDSVNDTTYDTAPDNRPPISEQTDSTSEQDNDYVAPESIDATPPNDASIDINEDIPDAIPGGHTVEVKPLNTPTQTPEIIDGTQDTPMALMAPPIGMFPGDSAQSDAVKPTIIPKAETPGAITNSATSNQLEYAYVYAGSPIQTPGAMAPVYKIIPLALSQDMKDSSVSGLGLLDISSFNEMKKEYTISIDYTSGNITVNADRTQWEQDYSECVATTCANKTTLTDTELQKIANSFFKEHGIPSYQFGSPIIDKQNLGGSSIKQYIPDLMTVTYPYLIDGKMLYSKHGDVEGMHVDIDTRMRKIKSISLRKFNLESSMYSTASKDAILKYASNGGVMYKNYVVGNATRQLTLGTPDLVLTRVDIKKDGSGEEVLVYAYKFPVHEGGKNNGIPEHVIVPIIEDLLNETYSMIVY